MNRISGLVVFAAFRAVGQEPGWLLEISNGDEILLVSDYGSTRSSMPCVEPCTDSMSGEEFEVSVTIKQTNRKLQGCGRALY